jgi:hypothetical protein
MDDGRIVGRRVIARVVDHFRRLSRADRWITLIATGFILVAPPAAWTMRRPAPPPASTGDQVLSARAPSMRPAAPAASFVIEPIVSPPPARPKRSSPSLAATRGTKRAPSKRQWIASLSRPTWRRPSPAGR